MKFKPEGFVTILNQSTERMIEGALEHAKRILVGAGPDAELMPMWHLLKGNGEEMIIATPFFGATAAEATAQKRPVADKMRETMREQNAVAYSFVSEAWCARLSPEQAREHDRSGRGVVDRDDRIEVVMILSCNLGGSQERCFEIVRDATGSITELKAVEQELGLVSGRFANLLEGNR